MPGDQTCDLGAGGGLCLGVGGGWASSFSPWAVRAPHEPVLGLAPSSAAPWLVLKRWVFLLCLQALWLTIVETHHFSI